MQLEKADRIAYQVKIKLDKIYGQIKWELNNKKTNTLEKHRKIKGHLYRIIQIAFDTMADGFEDMALTSFAEAGHILSRSIPTGHLSLITELKPITEAITQKQKDQIKDAIFDPMAPEKVDTIVKGKTKGLSWQGRLAQQTSLAPPEHLASIVTTGFVSGDTPATLANKILPFVQGIQSTAKRVARNESMRIAHESRMEAYEDLGDMVVGYQIHATMDSRVRPHHAARSGQIYYKNPKAGQLGMDKMPRPPIEEDGSVAHNCRCWITPVLEIQSQIEEDPAAKALFTDNKGDLIPNPSVYTTWFKNANKEDQKKVVGAKRIAAVQARIGPSKSIDWSHFVDPKTGKLLDADFLANETNEAAEKRVASFKRLITKRDKLTQDVYTYGYIPPSPGKLINQIDEKPLPPSNPVKADDIPIAAQIANVNLPVKKEDEIKPGPAKPNDFTDISNWEKVGSQKGSNEGGTFKNELGQTFYIKTPKSESHAENEILASELYKIAGINSVEVFKGNMDGKPKTISPIIDATATLADKIKDPAILKELQKGFAIDCWLSNWDVAGLENDNVIIDSKGLPVRVDPGGCLLYRAMGKPKGAAFGKKVTELESFFDPDKAPQASRIYKTMTEADKKESASKLLLITDDQITEMVKKNISSPSEAESLATILKARKQDILKKYGLIKDDSKEKELEKEEQIKPIEKALEKPVLKSSDQIPEPDYKVYGEMELTPFIVLWKSIASQYKLANKNDTSVDEILERMQSANTDFLNEEFNHYIPTYPHTYWSYAKIMFNDGYGFDETKDEKQKVYSKIDVKDLWKTVLSKNLSLKKEEISANWMLAKMGYEDLGFSAVSWDTKIPGWNETYEEYAAYLIDLKFGFTVLDSTPTVSKKEDKPKSLSKIDFKVLWNIVLYNYPNLDKESVNVSWMLKKMGEEQKSFANLDLNEPIEGGKNYYSYANELFDASYGFNNNQKDAPKPSVPAGKKDYTKENIRILYYDVVHNYLISYKSNLSVSVIMEKMGAIDPAFMKADWDQLLPNSFQSINDYIEFLYDDGFGFDKTSPDTMTGPEPDDDDDYEVEDDDDEDIYAGKKTAKQVKDEEDNQPEFRPKEKLKAPKFNKTHAEQLDFQKAMGSKIHLNNYLKTFQVTKETAGVFIPMGPKHDKTDKNIYTRYLGSEHEYINGKLRSTNPDVLAKIRDETTTAGKEIKELNDKIVNHGSIIPKGTILYRGGIGFASKPGFYTDHGFLSTSMNYATAYSFYANRTDKSNRKVYTIFLEDDIRCAVVASIAEEAKKPSNQSASIPGVSFLEHEFLFPTNCRFLITGKVFLDNTWEMRLYAPL